MMCVTSLRKSQWLPLLLLTITSLLSSLQVTEAHPPPPQENDIFGTVYGCASALVEMDDNQDGMIKRGEYLDFVNLLADFLCLPPRPVIDLELQTVFFSIACLCQEREGFDKECCHGNDAAIFTKGAANAVTRTEDQDSYLRAACLLTQAVLGPEQCIVEPQTLSPGAMTYIKMLPRQSSEDELTDAAKYGMIAGAVALVLLCCLLFCCACCRREEEEEDSEEEVEIKEEVVIEKTELLPFDGDYEKADPEKGERPGVPTNQELNSVPITQSTNSVPSPVNVDGDRSVDVPSSINKASFVVPALAHRSAPGAPEEEAEEGSGKRHGHSPDEDGADEHGRRFGGEGQLPPPPGIERVQLRHVEVEKGQRGDYEYPERQLIEEKQDPDEDSVQEFERYVPDGGVFIPERPKKAPVVFNAPKYQRPVKPTEEVHDPRKLRRQLGVGDGTVWEALAKHENTGVSISEQKFEWVVQGALDVLAKAQESGDLTKPRPRHAGGSSTHVRVSATPPPAAPKNS